MAESKWIDGRSVLPQPHTVQTIEWVWCNGQSGDIEADVYTPSAVVAVGGMIRKYLVPVGNLNHLSVSRQSSRHRVRIGR